MLEPGEAHCEHCGRLGEEIGRKTSEQIDRIPARLIVRRTVRLKRRCQCGCGQIAIAPRPMALLSSSKLGVGLAGFLLRAKDDDPLALDTLERIFRERHGVIIARQQMVQGIEHIAGRRRRLGERMKQSHPLQIDETPVKVLDLEVKGKAARGSLWFFAGPGGDVFLVFDRGRSHRVPVEAMSGFSGTFQRDASQVYEVPARKWPKVRRLGCAAHARRRFYDAALEGDRQALWFIGHFRPLYQIQDAVRDLPDSERQALRPARAPQIWVEMKTRAEELKPTLLPQSTLGKAIGYFLNEDEGLRVYLEAPEFQIDNNWVENAIRPSCVGKKRWLFIGHPEAGGRSAVIYSIIQSCRRRGIDPQQSLTDILGRLPGLKNNQLDALLPEQGKAARAGPDRQPNLRPA